MLHQLNLWLTTIFGESQRVDNVPTDKPDFEISAVGLHSLIQEEGYRTRAYKDSKGLLTIGVGHLITEDEKKRGKINLTSGESISIETRWTKEQVSRLLRDDLVRFQDAVNTVKHNINQGQFDALVSFAFNIGVRGFLTSTAYKYIKSNRHIDVPDAMLMWNKPRELIPRRRRESQKYAAYTAQQ